MKKPSELVRGPNTSLPPSGGSGLVAIWGIHFAKSQTCKPCDGACPSGECFGAANFDAYPTTGCPTNARYAGGWCCNAETPIVIDVDGSGFALTDLEHGVLFNIGDHGGQHVSWTAISSINAWLALDRNHNGTIDDGSELFGNLTPQPDPPPRRDQERLLGVSYIRRPKERRKRQRDDRSWRFYIFKIAALAGSKSRRHQPAGGAQAPQRLRDFCYRISLSGASPQRCIRQSLPLQIANPSRFRYTSHIRRYSSRWRFRRPNLVAETPALP